MTATPASRDGGRGEALVVERDARRLRDRRTGNRSRRRRARRSRRCRSPSVIRSRERWNRSRIGWSQASPSFRPKATAAWRLGAVEKVRNWCARATTRSERRRRHHPTDLPAGQREDLARRADLDRPLGHPGQRRKRREAAAVEDDMLPHLVADDDEVVLAGERRDDLQLVHSEQPPGRIMRVVEQEGAGPGRDRALQRLAVDPPFGRPERDFDRASRPPFGSSARSCHRPGSG